MTPERIAELVARWVRLYTRDLPTPIAGRRVGEIDADLHDQIAHERAAGIGDHAIVRGIASRMLRGLAADLAWRGRQTKLAARSSTPEETVQASKPLYQAGARVLLAVAAILSLPLVAMLLTDDVDWTLSDFVLAGVLLSIVGVALELAARKVGNLAIAVAVAALGVVASVVGSADDSPGLVLLGVLLVASACTLGVRRAMHGR